MTRIVRSIQINADSVDVAYMDDTDVRLEGLVFQTHHISVGRGANYDDEIDQLEAAAESLVTDVLTDFQTSPSFDPNVGRRQLDDDDDDED